VRLEGDSMAVPSYPQFIDPLLRVLVDAGEALRPPKSMSSWRTASD
jgi:hypothetical protein